MTTLDDWVVTRRLGRVDCLKIDVEGAEILVLEGARSLLQERRPLVILEIGNELGRIAGYGYQRQALVDLLRNLGYALFFALRDEGLMRIQCADELLAEDNDIIACSPAQARRLLASEHSNTQRAH